MPWEWDDTNKEWVKAPAVVIPKRMTGVGQVVLGAKKLYWISMKPSAASSEFQVTDATAGSATPLLEYFHTGYESHIHNLDPPCPFVSGIYLETFTNMTSITFGYV